MSPPSSLSVPLLFLPLTLETDYRGLIKNFRPEIEERIAKFRAENGDVAFGGALKASFPLGESAVPDNLGLEAVRETRQIGA